MTKTGTSFADAVAAVSLLGLGDRAVVTAETRRAKMDLVCDLLENVAMAVGAEATDPLAEKVARVSAERDEARAELDVERTMHDVTHQALMDAHRERRATEDDLAEYRRLDRARKDG